VPLSQRLLVERLKPFNHPESSIRRQPDSTRR
jgi:hypothetical protein